MMSVVTPFALRRKISHEVFRGKRPWHAWRKEEPLRSIDTKANEQTDDYFRACF
jgi:hypothetical protein